MTDGPSEPDLGAADDGGQATPPPPPTVAATTETGGGSPSRPSWLMPAVLGLLIGLVVAVVAVVVTQGDGDEIVTGATNPVETTPAVTDPAPDTAADATTTPAADPPSATDGPTPSTTEFFLPPSSAPVTTAPPDSTTASDTTAPDTTAAPVTTAAPAAPDGPIVPADDGFARVGGTQFPIERTCVTRPFEPNSVEYVVFSYLFRNEAGVPQIADHWFDEGGVTGGSYSDGGRAVPSGYEFLGADEFALTLRTDAGTTRVAVNPPADGATDCPGRMVTNDADTPDFASTRTIVDVCFGSQAGPLQYVAYLSEGAAFTAAPNGDGTMTLHVGEPFVVGFVDPAANSATLDDGIEIRGRASSAAFTGPVTKDFVIIVDGAAARECTAVDVPFQ
ncbi:MAG: hypothetical protein HKN44_13780 [Ilumatobacter sp.]|nr:hypothetical protein [Ilumatobacter sp.]